MRRRGFLLMAAGTPWMMPNGALAQQSDRPRRIGLIVTTAETDPDAQARAAALREGLRELGWVEGRNLTIDYRWGGGDPGRVEAMVDELVARPPDAIVSNGTLALAALQRRTRTIPVVFVVVTNPVGAGFVSSLARPGGNITGFSTYEPEIGGKWFETLREFAPGIRRVAMISDPVFDNISAVAATAASFAERAGVAVVPIGLHSPSDDIEGRLAAFADVANGGMIAMPTAVNLLVRERLVAAAARHRLPAIYPFRPYAVSGGLMSYGFEPIDLFRRSAAYVDRIFKGERPAEMPVQIPTRFQLVLNLRAARDLGIEVPQMLLARADEVIE